MDHNWNYSEFNAYLLIYASYADLEFSDEEKSMILKLVSKEQLEKIEAVYHEASDFEKLQIILDHKGLYYPTAEQKAELLASISELFDTDGEYSKLEKSLMMFLERLL